MKNRSSLNPILEMSARELSLRIHRREISCAEVMEAYLDQIERLNPRVNAIVALRNREALLAEAGEKDRELARGRSGGWMHGFPQAVKDLEETAGIPSTSGSLILKDYVPDFDSVVSRRIKEAGAVVIGKTNVPEWGFGSQTYNSVYGATGNPYDPEKTSGGSSGGAACALALRMLPAADGSDFMGSLRNPAGWCNVYGFRPSWGRVPTTGTELYVNTCSMKGPMARNPADLALLLSTLSGYDEAAPFSLPDLPELKALTPENVNARLEADLSGRRIAWLGDWDGYLAMEPGILELCEKALGVFAGMGITWEAIKPPYDPEVFWNQIWLPFRVLSSAHLKPFYDDPEKRKLLKPEAVYEYEGIKKYSAGDLYNAGVRRTEWYRAMMEVFGTYDYIAVPTAQVFPFDKSIHWPEEIAGRRMDTYHRWMEVVSHWTASGNPVAAVPAGFGPEGHGSAGLPMGLQLIGKPRGDFDLLQLIQAYHRLAGIADTRVPDLIKNGI